MTDMKIPPAPPMPPKAPVPLKNPPSASASLTGVYGSWDDMDVEEELKQFGESDGRQLKDYPPRELPDGTLAEQKWVRTRLGGQVDVENIQKHYEQKWRPRPASTLQGYLATAVPGFDTPVIGLSGHVLFERHAKLGAVTEQRANERRREQIASVKQTLMSKRYTQGGRNYGSVGVDEISSSLRRPAVQTDDD